MIENVKKSLQQELNEIKAKGLYKSERIITSPQGVKIGTTATREVLPPQATNRHELPNRS